MEINIDKSNWSKVKFGDVAIQMKGTVNRDNTDLKYYVKGEHMNSEDIHIREFGELTDEYLGPAFIRHFKKEDILYGSRRTYLKKVAVAHFEGITSNTTFVINAKEKVIDKRLIPFLMLSDRFTNHSTMHSKGSVNPYINWKDLANYEFLLPPKDQQAELADLLWAIDDVIEKDLEVLKRLEESTKVLFNSIYKDKSLVYKKLKDVLLNTQYGISNQLYDEGELPVLRMNNLLNGQIDFKDLKYINKSEIDLENYLLKEGDILFNRTNSFELVGKVSLFSLDSNYTFASYLVRLKCNTDIIDPRYLNLYLNSEQGKENVRQYRSPGVNQSNISPSNLIKLSIPVIDINNQRIISEYVYNYKAIISQMESKLSSSKSLQKSLINQIF
ncbi:TPA: restriction endonuclease subunit S [Elizabethkingia anophelis]|nr:hypothetical protein [Elizabethkingia anophelis]